MKASVLFLWLAACAQDGAASPAVAWPEGTVLAVDGVPVLASEVEPIAQAIAALYPENTRPHCRRLALTNVNLPQAALRSRFREERERAREACARRGATIAADPGAASALEGDWRALGLDLWVAARGLERGTWSGPLELVGRFALVCVDERTGDDARSERWSLRILEVPYAARESEDPQTTIAQTLDASRLTVVDPAWSEVVPESWKYRMRGEDR